MLVTLLLVVVAAAAGNANTTMEDNDALEPVTLDEKLVKLRCVPTAVARGPCHACVCTARGIYHCRPDDCEYSDRDATKEPSQSECEPDMLYNDGSLWCSCDARGFWKAANCRANFRYLRTRRAERTDLGLPLNQTCDKGSYFVVDCNLCECREGALTPGACTTRHCARAFKSDVCTYGQVLRAGRQLCACNEHGYYVEHQCVNLTSDANVQEITASDMSVLYVAPMENLRKKPSKCVPHAVVYRDCNRCTCNNEGKFMCTNRLCIQQALFNVTHSIRSSDNRASLPELSSDKESCTPGQQYRYRCNSCYCTNKGLPVCTTMICVDFPKNKQKDFGMSPGFQQHLPNINEGEKCTQGQTYRQDCNVCHCGSANRLICTKKLCLTHSEIAEQIEFEKKMKKKINNAFSTRQKKFYMELFKDKAVIHQGEHKSKLNKRKLITRSHNPKNNQKNKKKNKQKKKEHKKNKDSNKIKKTIRSTSVYPEIPKTKCKPGQIYSKGCQRCFCNNKKIAHCTNRPCEELKGPVREPIDVYPRINKKEMNQLTSLPHEAARCKPGRAYMVECNTCLCLNNGNLLCSSILCAAVSEVNRLAALKQSRQNCTPDNATYPQEECIHCTCVNDKFQCTQLPYPCTPVRFRRTLHGQHEEEETKNLLSLDEKCTPGMVYKQSCNNCYCQPDGSLRCTRKGCLNYQQVQKLKQQRTYLLKQSS